MHDALRPWQGDWNYDAAAHLWRRAGFGATPAALDRWAAGTPAAAIAAAVNGAAKDDATRELESIYASVLGTSSVDSARAWLLTRMARGGHPLREKLGLFWHGHFATSVLKVTHADWMLRQYRLFLDLGLGKFAALLDAVTRDPAMIRWLDNETNTKGKPNENYARELFELFTLGDGHYTEKDIQEAARAFTGWRILKHRYHFSTSQHDEGQKTVLGKTGNFNGNDICRIALAQDSCGRFLAGKLLRFFVTPEPATDIVAAFGAELKARDYDMTSALGLLFASRYFFAAENRRTLIKSPIEYVMTAVRVMELRLDAGAAAPALRAMGQDVLAPPNVKGWPGHTDWINTTTWLNRVNAARRLLDGYNRKLDKRRADRLARALFGADLPAAEHQRLQRSGAGKRDLAHALLALPEAQLA